MAITHEQTLCGHCNRVVSFMFDPSSEFPSIISGYDFHYYCLHCGGYNDCRYDIDNVKWYSRRMSTGKSSEHNPTDSMRADPAGSADNPDVSTGGSMDERSPYPLLQSHRERASAISGTDKLTTNSAGLSDTDDYNARVIYRREFAYEIRGFISGFRAADIDGDFNCADLAQALSDFLTRHGIV